MTRRKPPDPPEPDLFGYQPKAKAKPSARVYDLTAARAARDAGMDSVAGNNPEWMPAALQIVAHMPRGWRGLTEDLRPVIEAAIGPPTHTNAYGALARIAKSRGLLRVTGRRRQMRLTRSHARNTDEYER